MKLKINIRATNPDNIVDQTEGNIKILVPQSTDKPVLRGDKATVAKSTFSINDLIKMQNTPIEDCYLYDGAKKVSGNQEVISIVDNNSYLENLTNKVGNYERFNQGAYDVISYYKESSSSTLEFGKIEIYKLNAGTKNYDKSSTLYLPNTIRHTSGVYDSDSGYLFHSIVSNEGVGSALKFTVSYDGVFSTRPLTIVDEYNFYHKAHIFLSKKPENDDKTIDLTVVAYSNLIKVFTTYNIRVTIADAESGQQNSWTADVLEDSESSNPVYRVEEYDFIQNLDTNKINFYVVTDGNEPSVGRITYNKETKKFENDDPLLTIKFETGEGKTDSQVYGIGCSKDVVKAARGTDSCAFSTYGAVVYYAEMENGSAPTPSSASLHDVPEDELKQGPTPTSVKITRLLRLRRINQNFGKNVFVLDDNVILETERIIKDQTKNALIWDVKDYKDGAEATDVGVNEVITLTQETAGKGPQSQYDSVLINAIAATTSTIQNPEFDLVVINEIKKGERSSAQYVVGMKRLSTYVLNIKELPTAEVFNKLSVRCLTLNSHKIDIPLSDFMTMPADEKDL